MLTRKVIIFRAIAKVIGGILLALFTRTRVIGRENIPEKGPVIFAANHASTFDGVLYLLFLPLLTQVVGPGDFKLKRLTAFFIVGGGLIRTKRGSVDRDSLNQMVDVLKGGMNLALFPEGGTWEKRIDDVKSGAAYLSSVTGAAIVPIAISGAYDVWKDIYKLKRPRIVMQFAPPLPPVEIKDRRRRHEELQEFSLEMMRLIYSMLSPEEQRRYDLMARQIFTATLEVTPPVIDLANMPNFRVIAELTSKKNLFSPFHEHTGLPVQPFLNPNRFYPAEEFKQAVDSLHHALTTNFSGYLQYRLGNRKAREGVEELELLQQVAQQAVEKNLAVKFTPNVTLSDTTLPPNE